MNYLYYLYAMKKIQGFTNLFDLLTYFKSEQVCCEYLEQIRWASGLVCPYEDCKNDHIFRCKNNKYKCSECKRRYSVRIGSMFEDSHLPLQKWFAAIYLVTAHKKGISSLQLHRDIGVTQKTAWFMLHRIRHTFGLPQTEQLTGTIEADETFIGGSEKNKHKSKKIDNAQGRSVKGKSAVAGLLERGGELRAQKVPDTSGKNLRKFIVENVEFNATLNTDEWGGYNGLGGIFIHKRINHLLGEYVNGDTHTNGMEGFWALLKRSIYGIYHSVSDKHLQNYVEESVFRYNSRKETEDTRFKIMLSNIGKHISYKQLTKNDSTGNNNQMGFEQGVLGI